MSSIYEEDSSQEDSGPNTSDSKFRERYVKMLRRVFSDSSGEFTIDAVVVAANDDETELFRMESRDVIVVPLERLASEDKEWLKKHQGYVQAFGPRLKAVLLDGAASVGE